jgi:hypothetical protein
MSCIKHLSLRSRKAEKAPYCRSADWWKETETEASEHAERGCIVKRSAYLIRPRKKWSIIILSAQGGRAESARLEDEFDGLVKQWTEETFHQSSLTKIYAHPAYQRIMAMGTAGIPLVLKALRAGQGRWFYALKFMAGTDVSAGMQSFESARAAWLEWGTKKEYI